MVVRRSSGRREHGHDRRPTRLTGRSGPEPARSSPLWISSGPPGGVAGCRTLVWRCGIADSPWPVIHTEHAVLADDLADLAPTAGPPRRCAGAGRYTRYSSDTVPSRDHGINAGLGLAPPVHGSHTSGLCLRFEMASARRSRRGRWDDHAFAGSSEDAEDFRGFVAGAAEPVRHRGVESGD